MSTIPQQMKLSAKYFFSFVLIVMYAMTGRSQEKAGDDIILKAMQDELTRNMNDLRLPGYDKPFFIMYGIQDQRTFTLASTLGSIVQSNERPARFKSTTRVLVGDYEFNDESLEDNLTSSPTAMEINLPIDDDYMGIRRSLWSSTDKVYRDAARHFQRHQQTLKETGKPLKDIPHRSFAKGSPLRSIATLTPYSFDKLAWEKKIKNLSSVFLKHPGILYSSVIVTFTEGHKYLINSEGVVAKIPFRDASFLCIGQLKSADGEFVIDQVRHRATLPDEIPSELQLQEEINAMISRIENQLKTPRFEEEYSGPVLLTGAVVADVFSAMLFSNAEGISASNFIPGLTGYQFNRNSSSMDNKIGKGLYSNLMTVKAKPKLKSYNGVNLLASFDIDDEGIVPPDELIIVENGVLKNLLNDRTITHESQVANGFSSGPGVVEITLASKNTDNALKEKLIARAKDDGLEYGLMIKQSAALMGIVNVFKVYVADGREELARNAFFEEMNLKMFKRMIAASEKYQAHNLNGSNFNGGEGGTTLSIIVPESVMFQEMEIRPFDMPTLKEEEYVSNPLVKN